MIAMINGESMPDIEKPYDDKQAEMDPDSSDGFDADDSLPRSFLIPAELDGARLDAALGILCPEKSRSFWQKMIEEGHVSCSGAAVTKSGKKVKAGDEILAVFPAPKDIEILPENIPLDILYEDDDIIVVNKPKGMVVHPAPGHFTGTLVNALMYHCADSLSGINGVMRPGIVHRIDRDTTGSLVAAKNDRSHASLAAQFKEHSINRSYRAILHGRMRDDEVTVDKPLGRHPQDRKKMAVLREGQGTSRRAVTHIRVLERFSSYTYVECVLETGRTHQIRVHTAYIGHPVLGDEVYGPKRCPYRLEGQTLHAMVLGLRHPSTDEYMEFKAPLPAYFDRLLSGLSTALH